MNTQRTVEERLAALETASDERRAELRAVLDDLPHAISRRTLVVEAAKDLRAAPDKGQIVTRGVRKLGRAPAALVRRIRGR
ncbi:MAG: hypothetical protein AB8G14_17980 [Ilumatobacter sp.]